MLKKILQIVTRSQSQRLNRSFRLPACASAFIASTILLPGVFVSGPTQAEFQLNFLPETSRYRDPEWLNFNCRRPFAPGGGFEDCDDNDDFRDNNGRDQTSFLMERVRDPNSNDQYYHQIVGLPGDDFYQEAYIKITRYMSDNGGISYSPREVDDLGPISDSLGDWSDITERPDNAYDPLGNAAFSGSGTANPKSTQFWQVIDNGEIRQDIKKEHFNKKHLITQDIDTRSNPSSAGIVHEFELDMRNSTFDQAHIAGLMNKNTLLITDGIGGEFNSFFDINNMPRNTDGGVDVDGGMFLYNQRYSTSMSGSDFQNEYEGQAAGYNIWDVDWKMFYDPAQNVGYLYGCYSDCMNGGGGGSGWGGSGWGR